MEAQDMIRKRKHVLLSILDDDDEEDSSSDDDIVFSNAILKSSMLSATVAASVAGRGKRTIANGIEEIVPNYSDNEFKIYYRISRELFERLHKKFEESEVFSNLRHDKRMTASTHLLLFLWFAGHDGCTFKDLADRFDVSKSSVHIIIKRVSMFLSGLCEEAIQWPNDEAKTITAVCFEKKFKLPKIIGCIAGTRIFIDPPAQNKNDYVDRNGQTNIWLQGICNENRKFIDIFIGYPGSVDESIVFHNSFIFSRLESEVKGYFILGDSAYPLSLQLLTPFEDDGQLTAPQKLFNRQLSSCRVTIEHTFTILKQRFRQLNYCRLKGIENICHFIRACCVLHNLGNESDLDELDIETVEDDVISGNEENADEISAETIREHISQELWRIRNF